MMVRLVALVIVAAAIAVPSVLVHLDHEYGPIEPGDFGGQYRRHGLVWNKGGFGFSLAPDPHVKAWMIATLYNPGSHSVTVTSVDRTAIVANVMWSRYSMRGTNNGEGRNTPWHNFPTVVLPKQQVRILIVAQHPSYCSKINLKAFSGTSMTQFDGLLTVHWDSLLHSHTSTVDTGLSDFNIAVC